MKGNAGFTLLELILVMLIIGILAGMVTLSVAGRGKQAKVVRAQADLSVYEQAIDMYALEHNETYPKNLEVLAVEDERGISYIKRIKNDPWGSPYVYRYPSKKGNKYDLFSRGPDKQDGTEDDIDVQDIE